MGNYNSRISGGLPHSPARCYALALLRTENNKAEGISVNWLLDCISRTQRRGHLLGVVQILGCCHCACLLGDPESEEREEFTKVKQVKEACRHPSWRLYVQQPLQLQL